MLHGLQGRAEGVGTVGSVVPNLQESSSATAMVSDIQGPVRECKEHLGTELWVLDPAQPQDSGQPWARP